MKNKSDVKIFIDILKKDSIGMIEFLIGEWLEYKFTPSIYESEEEFRKRKVRVLPLLINEKLTRYEEEY
jgi:hypothetical protein